MGDTRPMPRLIAFVLSVLAAGAAPPALAQASVPDTMAQRLQACTVCHGKEGRATRDGYFPRIAGKPAAYLHNQLRHFQAGRRQAVGMASLLDHLDDAYLRESILTPMAKTVKGYPPAMPTFQGQLTEEQVMALIAYIKSLGGNAPGAAAAH